ncbi:MULTISPECIES: hypothetical protein [unclassified Corynebacterium]|uniref:hypothetical protein n=1 Tax=unclassified Corynebacterium TaxID=2624378 RepID=UPI00264C9E81|nr:MULTISPECIES: hypothetical protein [unclassified Corynebacterium]MDN8594132.1 hypothetical protein [Corynebacterium sp. P4_F2]WKK55013.1 hypothetical protein QYR03_07225 [Corynebacterium sp. P4-C1]
MKSLSFATLFAALSGFVVLWVASWSLDAGTQMPLFQAYWSLFFASAGFIDGITQETTRAVASARERGVRGSASPWLLAGIAAAAVAALTLAAGVAAMGHLVPPTPRLATALLVFGLGSYVFQAVLSGILSGAGLWNQYAGLVALDSGIRLVLACVAWAAGWGLPAFLAITVIGAASWVAVLASSGQARGQIRAALDVDRAVFVRRVLSAVLATGASALLITGFPAMTTAAFAAGAGADMGSGVGADAGTGSVTGAAVAAVNQAVLLTRAPVLVPLQRFQSALVVRFVEQRSRIYSSLAVPIGAILSVGSVGFVAAWLVGPWILRAFFPPELFVPGVPLGLLTFASAIMGALIITGTAVLALEQHTWYVAGWVTGAAAAFGLLFALPATLGTGVTATVILALTVGPLVGAAVHLAGLAGAARHA